MAIDSGEPGELHTDSESRDASPLEQPITPQQEQLLLHASSEPVTPLPAEYLPPLVPVSPVTPRPISSSMQPLETGRFRLGRGHARYYISRKRLRKARLHDRKARQRLWTIIISTTMSFILVF